jgi:hypothetical protein
MSAEDTTWSVKEVFDDLKKDILQRFDRQDDALRSLDRRLDATATKVDLRDIHQRIDGVEARLTPLEQQVADERAIATNRERLRGRLAWLATLVGSAAVVASVVVLVVVH